jgi:hypothetical protein
MSKALILVLGAMLLGSIAAGAAEWWEKKQYTEWTEKEVRWMLNNSP